MSLSDELIKHYAILTTKGVNKATAFNTMQLKQLERQARTDEIAHHEAAACIMRIDRYQGILLLFCAKSICH